MRKSILDDDQWLALFAEEMAGVPRRELVAKYGVSKSAISAQAIKRGLTKRDTGAPDHRFRPAGGWPEDRPIPQNAAGLTPKDWRKGVERWLAGEADRAVAADLGVSTGGLHNQAAAMNMRKCDRPDAVYCSRRPRHLMDIQRLACAFVFDPDDLQATEAALAAQARVAAIEGRTHDFTELQRTARAARRWPAARPVDLVDKAPPEVDEAPSAPALILRTSQLPPEALPDGGPWSTWLFLGGRGAGKTLAGASWLADQAGALGPGGRLALIGPTLHDVREVMIEGVSGIRSLPRWTRATRPVFQASRRRLVFANGCQAYAFSAEDPDSLRGPQFSAAWADEFCAWRGSGPRGAAETLALLRMGLRLAGPEGRGPRLVVTTTPRPTRALVRLRDEATCALTHAPTAENAAHLSAGFLDGLEALYGGTRRAAQELEGKVVELDGALFTAAMMAAARRGEGRGARVGGNASPSPEVGRDVGAQRRQGGGRTDQHDGAAAPHPSVASRHPPSPEGEGDRPSRPRTPALERIVVAIDPTATAGGAACGLIAAGSFRRADGVRCAVVLADRSIAGLGPDAWARRAVALAAEVGATALVAEVNQGGDMVKAVLKTAGCRLKVREVHATRGKYVRAEPVAALYEQGRIHHAGAFDALEEELMAFGGEMEAAGSLDRADALVWAVTDLLIDAPEGDRGPRVRWV